MADHSNTLNQNHRDLLSIMAQRSYEAFVDLKNHPKFISYLTVISPLNYYNETNIASRPSKRKQTTSLVLDDLRAIPLVSSRSQIKQNVPGYFGVGTALEDMEEEGKWSEVEDLYQSSLFFKTLIENTEMAMKKCFFP